MAKKTTYVKKKNLVLRIFIVFVAIALLLGIIILPLTASADDSENITVASFEMGKLADALTEAADGTDFNFIKNVAVLEGTLNADDYAALTNIPNLEILELAGTETENGIIPENALTSRNQLSLVTLPKNTVEIGKNAFSNNRKLIKVTMPSSVSVIGDYAFSSCESMSEFPISEAVTYIGEGAFQDCKALTEFVIPSGITEIYANTFSKCGFEKISIGPDVKKIGMSVFADCNALKDVYVYGTEAPALDSDVFRNVSATVHCSEEAEESFESWAQNNITIAADLTGEYTVSTVGTTETTAETETAETEKPAPETAAENDVADETEAVTDSSAGEEVTTSEEIAETEASAAESSAATSAPAEKSDGLSVGVVVVIVIMAVVIAVLATMLVMTKKNNKTQS
ncbi:MAG: leucine-rich repeat domain-containing protein [Oscillospiraceae bacterium]|nr:leucine-rich repeat domain-containing protein [Oscillospiraceae bacterium]